MDLLKLSLALLCVLNFSMFGLSRAQDSPQDYVDAHNAARALVGVGPIPSLGVGPIPSLGVGPIEWDETVANYARQYANERINDCQLLHSEGPYGENLAWSGGDMSGIDAVKMWVNEEPFYDYSSNSCIGNEMCGHYTQVVWKNTTRVGCAKVRCSDGGTFITCNYDPPGNVIGEWPF